MWQNTMIVLNGIWAHCSQLKALAVHWPCLSFTKSNEMAPSPHSLHIWAMEKFDLKKNEESWQPRGNTSMKPTFLSRKSTDVSTELNYESNERTWMSPLFCTISSQNLKVHKVRRLLCNSSVWGVDITERPQCGERERKEWLSDSNTSSHTTWVMMHSPAMTSSISTLPSLRRHCIRNLDCTLTLTDFFLTTMHFNRSSWLLQICFPPLCPIDWYYHAIIRSN